MKFIRKCEWNARHFFKFKVNWRCIYYFFLFFFKVITMQRRKTCQEKSPSSGILDSSSLPGSAVTVFDSLAIKIFQKSKQPDDPNSYQSVSLLCTWLKADSYQPYAIEDMVAIYQARLGSSSQLHWGRFSEKGVTFVDLTTAYDTTWKKTINFDILKVILSKLANIAQR